MASGGKFLKKATGSAAQHAPAKRRGLGRGMDSLIPPAPSKPRDFPAPAEVAGRPSSEPPAPFELPVAEIEPSPYQPRREIREEELAELAASLKNSGLVHPPTVRRNKAGRYELVSGERRLRAAQLAGWKKIPVTFIDVDDLTAASMTATENLQREDLNPIEEASSYKTLQDAFNLTQSEVAERVGKGRATVANAVRLLELPEEVKSLVETKLLSSGHAKVLLSVEDERDRVVLARECVNFQLSVRALEKRVARLNAPVRERKSAVPDFPESYARALCDKMRRIFGSAVRLTPGMTHANGKHVKGVIEIDFFNNDDLDRILKLIGLEAE